MNISLTREITHLRIMQNYCKLGWSKEFEDILYSELGSTMNVIYCCPQKILGAHELVVSRRLSQRWNLLESLRMAKFNNDNNQESWDTLIRDYKNGIDRKIRSLQKLVDSGETIIVSKKGEV